MAWLRWLSASENCGPACVRGGSPLPLYLLTASALPSMLGEPWMAKCGVELLPLV